MPATFDLLERPWLPCLVRGEEQPRDVSLREALARAPAISELNAASPLETAAIHRLLLAILHRVIAIKSTDAWADLWEAGEFDMNAIDRYLSQWHSCFDLFDAQRPFFQTPALPESSATTIVKLGHEYSAGNNALLFDHSHDDGPPPIATAAAARMLVAHHAFAIGGLIGRLPGDPPSAEAAHLVKAAVLLNTGANLFETLLLNMVQVDGLHGYPFEFEPSSDSPAWERSAPQAIEREPAGYLDLLTWQSRRILLFPDGDGETVSRAAIMAGYRFPRGLDTRQRETQVAYTKRDNPARNQDPWSPVGFRPGKALWRDSFALLQGTGDRSRRASSTEWLAILRNDGVLDRDRVFGLAAFGLSSDRAKVFLWRREDLPLPVAYLENPDLVTVLGRGVGAAEGARNSLRRATWRLAEAALAPGPDRSADRDRVDALVQSLQTERAYWPALDVHFRKYIVTLAAQYTTDRGQAANKEIATIIRDAAERAFEGAARAVETSSRGYRAVAETRATFHGALFGALKELMPERTANDQPEPEETLA